MIIYVVGDIKNQMSIMVSPTEEWQKKVQYQYQDCVVYFKFAKLKFTKKLIFFKTTCTSTYYNIHLAVST